MEVTLNNAAYLFLFGALAACGDDLPSDELVIEVAREQLRSGLAQQAGGDEYKKDPSLEAVVQKSRYSIAEPCQAAPQLPSVVVCAVAVNVALPANLKSEDGEATMPVMMTKNREGEWVNAMNCEGDFAPQC